MTAGCLAAAAAAITWPAPRRQRSRLRRLSAPSADPPIAGRAGATMTLRRWLPSPSVARGRPMRVCLVAAATLLAGVSAGPVAGGAVAAYGVLAARAAVRRAARQDLTGRRRALLDQMSATAADLRAGLPVAAALAAAGTGGGRAAATGPAPPAGQEPTTAAGGGSNGVGVLRERFSAAVALAERTGAPLADLLERIEADARAVDRADASVAAQIAGSQATAWLLAGLPAGGIALGYAIGTDPLAVLLHTPVGAGCAAGAIALQVAGMAWTRRLMRAGGAAA